MVFDTVVDFAINHVEATVTLVVAAVGGGAGLLRMVYVRRREMADKVYRPLLEEVSTWEDPLTLTKPNRYVLVPPEPPLTTVTWERLKEKEPGLVRRVPSRLAQQLDEGVALVKKVKRVRAGVDRVLAHREAAIGRELVARFRKGREGEVEVLLFGGDGPSMHFLAAVDPLRLWVQRETFLAWLRRHMTKEVTAFPPIVQVRVGGLDLDLPGVEEEHVLNPLFEELDRTGPAYQLRDDVPRLQALAAELAPQIRRRIP